MSEWDQFDGAAGNFIPLAEYKAGDEVDGVILSIGAKRFDDKPDKAVPQLILDLGDGAEEPSTLTAGYVMLVSALKKAAPEVGDRIKFSITKIGPKPKEMREFSEVQVWKKGTFPWPPNGAVPTAATASAVADAPAGITPEQLAAMQAMSAPAPAWDSDPRVAQLRGMGIADEAIRSTLNI